MLKLKLISTCCTLLLVGGCGSDHQSSSITDTSQIKSIYNVSDVASLDIDINCSNVLSELKKSSKDVVIFLVSLFILTLDKAISVPELPDFRIIQ